MPIREFTAKLPAMRRASDAEFGPVDTEKRTCEISFSSSYPVERWFGTEILDHGPGADFKRLNNGGPLLWNHDKSDQRGVVENARIEYGKGRATVRFSRNEKGDALMKDVADRIVRNASFGYRLKEVVITERNGEPDEYLVRGWEAYEVSFVSVPADPTVGAERGAPDENTPRFDAACKAETSFTDQKMKRSFLENSLHAKFRTADDGGTVITSGASPQLSDAERALQVAGARKDESARIKDIYAIGRRFASDTEAEKAVNEGTSVDGFRAWVMDNKVGKPAVVVATENPNIGMNAKETRTFSLMNAVRQIANGGALSGLEKEASETAAAHFKRSMKPGAICIPNEVAELDLGRALGLDTRAINATTFGQGGALVQMQYGPMIEILNNASVLGKLGITVINGLVGDLVLPQQTGGGTAYWVSETGTLTDTSATFSQKTMTPHRCGATIPFTTQFLNQTSIGAEAFLRSELMTRLALLQDLAGLEGTGNAGQPLGVKNTTGINQTVTFGGAATWADLVEFETGIAVDNADIGSMGFALSAQTVGKWKTILKDSVAGAGYLIGEGGTANGYGAQRTNQITGNIAFFGVWSQLVKASWAGMEVIVDPYALKKSGQIEITVNQLCDYLVRQPLAFNISTDSAAQ